MLRTHRVQHRPCVRRLRRQSTLTGSAWYLPSWGPLYGPHGDLEGIAQKPQLRPLESSGYDERFRAERFSH